MQLGMVGLGRMGSNMAERLVRGNHAVVGFDPSADARKLAGTKGVATADSLAGLVEALSAPRVVWLMVPAGQITDDTVNALSSLLTRGDILIDGGNSNYHDTLRRAALCAGQGLGYVDCGTSGGIWGLKEGYSLMIGATEEAMDTLRPIFETLAPDKDRGWGRVGPVGSGHFTKMIHNGIEYGLMQAYAEGFSILRHKQEFKLDLHQIGEIWRHGSVVRSWLLDLTVDALGKNPGMDGIAPYVADSGEGRWTVAAAIEENVPADVLTTALYVRFRSRQDHTFAEKLLSALRAQFGGHVERPR